MAVMFSVTSTSPDCRAMNLVRLEESSMKMTWTLS